MDPLKNPFSPGAGFPPPELAGRQNLLDRSKIVLGRMKAGASEKSFVLVGLRGVGKTVLLNEIHKYAQDDGFKSTLIEAHEGKSLAALLLPQLRQILFSLDQMENINQKVKRAFRVLKSFFNGIKLKTHDIETSLDVDPEQGAADSGDLESDLPVLFEAIAEQLKLKSQSVVPTRNSLMKKGMIYSPSYGDTEFTVPLFDDFMRRAMPLE